MMSEMVAKVEALQNAFDDFSGGHSESCRCVCGPAGETWIDEWKECDCGWTRLRAAIKEMLE